MVGVSVSYGTSPFPSPPGCGCHCNWTWRRPSKANRLVHAGLGDAAGLPTQQDVRPAEDVQAGCEGCTQDRESRARAQTDTPGWFCDRLGDVNTARRLGAPGRQAHLGDIDPQTPRGMFPWCHSHCGKNLLYPLRSGLGGPRPSSWAALA